MNSKPLVILLSATTIIFAFLWYDGTNETSNASSAALLNTYRDTHLSFEIGYPKDWSVTDYVDYDQNGGCVIYKQEGFTSNKYGRDVLENCGHGTSLAIATDPTPYQGWSLGFLPPSDYMSVHIDVKPKGETFDDPYDGQENVKLVDRQPIDGSEEWKGGILSYDYKDKKLGGDMGLPTAIAFYHGDNYTYEFSIPGWGPRSEEEIRTFKKIVASFKEIR